MSNINIPTDPAGAAAYWQHIADTAATRAERAQAQQHADFWRTLLPIQVEDAPEASAWRKRMAARPEDSNDD